MRELVFVSKIVPWSDAWSVVMLFSGTLRYKTPVKPHCMRYWWQHMTPDMMDILSHSHHHLLWSRIRSDPWITPNTAGKRPICWSYMPVAQRWAKSIWERCFMPLTTSLVSSMHEYTCDLNYRLHQNCTWSQFKWRIYDSYLQETSRLRCPFSLAKSFVIRQQIHLGRIWNFFLACL